MEAQMPVLSRRTSFRVLIELMSCKLCSAVAAALLLACQTHRVAPMGQGAVEPGARADSLVFVISGSDTRQEPIAAAFLFIHSCDGTRAPRWSIAPVSEEAPPIGRVKYGEVPSGYHGGDPASELTPGCYVLSVTGYRFTIPFMIDSSGAARRLTTSEEQDLLPSRP